MSKRSFLERLLYRYEYLGAVEKDGQVYKKFKKTPRIPHLRRYAFAVWYLLAVIILIVVSNAAFHLTSFKLGR